MQNREKVLKNSPHELEGASSQQGEGENREKKRGLKGEGRA